MTNWSGPRREGNAEATKRRTGSQLHCCRRKIVDPWHHPKTKLDGAPAVNGVVTAIKNNVVELSIGLDDGIRVNHELDRLSRRCLHRQSPSDAQASRTKPSPKSCLSTPRASSLWAIALTPNWANATSTERNPNAILRTAFDHRTNSSGYQESKSMNAPAPKQPYSVYTVMLISSAIFMLLACIMMGVEAYRYM